MFQRILVPLDGSSLSEQVVPFAAALAKAGKGSVTLLHVVDVSALQDTGQVWVEMPSVKQFVDEELARARTYLETVQGRLQADGVTADIEVAIGTPTGVIGDAIENTKAIVSAGVPTFGICLGHQILGLALGVEQPQHVHHVQRRAYRGQRRGLRVGQRQRRAEDGPKAPILAAHDAFRRPLPSHR